ncbi:MAG: hypothetical protein QOJ72_1680 [Nocardioidaceae bacterium]|jgi:hypothetical protein|nr:hypothetical protein [Nocardioidaceae bacterium]
MSRNRVRAAALSVAMIATVGLTVGLTETSVSASQKTEITESHPSRPITGEGFYIRGTISTHIARPVELQRKFHDTWKIVDTESTNDAGQFQFSTSTTVNRTYRVVAHSYTSGITYKLRKTAPYVVTLAHDTVKLTISPSPLRRGHHGKFTFKFGATRIGRELTQETIVNGGPKSVSLGPSETGRVMTSEGTIPSDFPKGTYKFRLIAGSWNGSTEAKSPWVTVTVK